MGWVYNGSKAGEVNDVLILIVDAFVRCIGGNLKGLYLHGSMAMGSFRPWSSDIDLLAVVNEPMAREDKLRLVEDIMDIAESGTEFRSAEFSVVTADEATRAAHPIGYILHYSNGWHQAYKEGKAELVVTGGTDDDLAAHFTVTSARGITLFGSPISETFGIVSREDYLKSVWYDIANSKEEVRKKPVYTILNLCRTLMYLETGRVGSKLEGGRWAASQSEMEQWKALIDAAATEYETGSVGIHDPNEWSELAEHLLCSVDSKCI